MTDVELREQVRAHYARAASSVIDATADGTHADVGAATCCAPAPETAAAGSGTAGRGQCCSGMADVRPQSGAALYSPAEHAELPLAAVAASLGCGNPVLVAELEEGETVLDLGCGGGIDVILAARRVGPRGFVHGVDLTEEMLHLATQNAAAAGVDNVEFSKGVIEDLPLPDASVDVLISNCVVNLSTDKAAAFAEMSRVLRPGGRVGISDLVADDDLTPADRAERGAFVACIAGALSRREYLDDLEGAGFTDAAVTFTHEEADGIHGALIRAVKPA